ncbi:MAG: hemerythrin domain-containing protein [Hyphomicrobium sp.]
MKHHFNRASYETAAIDNNQIFCSMPDPISLLEEEHELQRELCNVLEALADDLPSSFDKDLANVALSILESSLERHMKFEDEALFPLLRKCLTDTDPIHAALECLEEEHERDGANLYEITEALRSAIEDNSIKNAEMLGYILRGYFESLRRHVAWEDKVIVPTARSAFSTQDLAKLQAWIMESEHPRCCHQSILLIHKARSARETCLRCSKANPVLNVVPITSGPLTKIT